MTSPRPLESPACARRGEAELAAVEVLRAVSSEKLGAAVARLAGGDRWAEVAQGLAPEGCSPSMTDFLAHARGCAECRAALEGAARTVRALRAMAPVDGRDLVPDVLAALPRAGRPWWVSLWAHPLARAALAVLAVGTGVGLWLREAGRTTARSPSGSTGELVAEASADEVRRQAAEWLATTQRPDGTWDVGAMGGRAEHAPALTALGLMALQDEGSVAFDAALRKGAEALLGTQRENGCFGESGDFMMYNHGIATVALLRLQASGHLSAADASRVDKALAFIRAAQQPEGGWGYRPGLAGGPANASVTAWQLEALGLARRAGAGDPQGHLRKGLFWVTQLADKRGIVGYQRAGDQPSSKVTTTALGLYCLLHAGAGIEGVDAVVPRMARGLARLLEDPVAAPSPNPYRDFFVARASEACAAEPGSGAKPDASALRTRLVETRVPAGRQRCTWNLDDAYAHVGGRLYTTSLSAMALR